MKQMTRIILIAIAAIYSVACEKKDVSIYTVPQTIILNAPDVDAANSTVHLSAIYDGDDGSIANAGFIFSDAAGGGILISSQNYSNGKAEAIVHGLQAGTDYLFNFEITTTGGNIIKAEADMPCPFSKPSDFQFGTTATLTSKILQLTYTGCDAMIAHSRLIVTDQSGKEITENIPEIICSDGKARMMFRFSDWAEDIYNCTVEMTLYDESVLTTQCKLSLLPTPENIFLSTATIEEGIFNFSATYDGEDRTVKKAYFEIYSEDGTLMKTVEGKFADRAVFGNASGMEYGRYSYNCFLELVDGNVISGKENMKFIYAPPRKTETMSMLPDDFVKAGMITSAKEGMELVTYNDRTFEYENMYIKEKDGQFYVSSSKQGYISCSTPYKYGIKSVSIYHKSGKELANFACFGRSEMTDEWEEITNSVKDDKTFIYDLSGNDYKYFKFATKAKQELRALHIDIEYYTEAPIEF